MYSVLTPSCCNHSRSSPATNSLPLAELLAVARQIHAQERKDKRKIYSVHEPQVECISKGKAHKRYEFGCKVSVAATSQGGWFVGAKAMHGNPYDGHTLNAAIEQVKRIAKEPEQAFVDMGYPLWAGSVGNATPDAKATRQQTGMERCIKRLRRRFQPTDRRLELL